MPKKRFQKGKKNQGRSQHSNKKLLSFLLQKDFALGKKRGKINCTIIVCEQKTGRVYRSEFLSVDHATYIRW